MLKKVMRGYTVEPEDLIEGLKTYEAPTIEHVAIDEAVSYTEYLNRLHESSQLAYRFEKHSGFGRGYPGSPMLDENFKLTDKEKEVLYRMKARKPFQAGKAEYLDIVQEAFIGLAEAHNHAAPAVRHDGRWVYPKISSFYTPHVVFLTGPKSLITAFHEYTHSLGFGEVVATWWSTNVFRLLYPKSFEKLKVSKLSPHLMRRYVDDDVVAGPEFGERKTFSEFSDFMDDYKDFIKERDAEEEEEEDADALWG